MKLYYDKNVTLITMPPLLTVLQTNELTKKKSLADNCAQMLFMNLELDRRNLSHVQIPSFL